jgi:DNA-binding response OmpR family regulator
MGSPATDGRVVLLLVEDDTDMRSLLCDELSEMGHRIVEATNADQALRYVVDHTPTLVLSDLRMPAGGMGYVSRLRKSAPEVPIILMTAFGDAQTKADALALGVAAYFDKPVRISELKSAMSDILENWKPTPN